MERALSEELMPGDMSQVVYALGRVEPSGVRLLGTAFAVANDKIATAYHVVGADDRNLVMILPRVSSLLDYQDTTDHRVTHAPLKMHAADPIHDLCVLQCDANTAIWHNYTISSTDAVPPGAPVITFGFPHANFGRMVLTQQMAHVGARILIGSQGDKAKHLILNTQAREGQSGGPIFDISLQKLVAVLIGSYVPGGHSGLIVAGVDPASLHQTTHAVSAEYLQGMF
jgi:S1-C subfamily serine protease